MRMLQVCNVGNIIGGTAACAWSITRAIPDVQHHVVFLSHITDATRAAFQHCTIDRWERVDETHLNSIRPDLVLLHNVAPQRVGPIRSAVTMQYVHSQGRRANATFTCHCSRWLADRQGASPETILIQPVPKPPVPDSDPRESAEPFRVGRICTPQPHKWPADTIGFYERFAPRFPHVRWEFVGCPEPLQLQLQTACRGRAVFHAAAWHSRSLLWTWHAMLYHNANVTESFGRTVAESMRAGCIPIVDARGGFVEQVPEGCGFLCQSEENFAGALEQLPEQRQQLSHAATQHADAAFSLARFREKLLNRLR